MDEFVDDGPVCRRGSGSVVVSYRGSVGTGGSSASLGMITAPTCKANDAAIVKTMMSCPPAGLYLAIELYELLERMNTYRYWHKTVDGAAMSGVIIFTLLELVHSTNADGRQKTRHQAESSPTSRHAESATGPGYRLAVSDPRVLRCRRYDPGQVRDVEAGSRRPATGNSSREGFRLFTAAIARV